MPLFPRNQPAAPAPVEPAGAGLVIEVPLADLDACIAVARRRGDHVLTDTLLDLRNAGRHLRPTAS